MHPGLRYHVISRTTVVYSCPDVRRGTETHDTRQRKGEKFPEARDILNQNLGTWWTDSLVRMCRFKILFLFGKFKTFKSLTYLVRTDVLEVGRIGNTFAETPPKEQVGFFFFHSLLVFGGRGNRYSYCPS